MCAYIHGDKIKKLSSLVSFEVVTRQEKGRSVKEPKQQRNEKRRRKFKSGRLKRACSFFIPSDRSSLTAAVNIEVHEQNGPKKYGELTTHPNPPPFSLCATIAPHYV